MAGSFLIRRKAVARFIEESLHRTFESLEVGLDNDGLHLRGFDTSRTVVADVEVLPHALEGMRADEPSRTTLETRDLREFLAGVAPAFEDGSASLRVRFLKNDLELTFRHEPSIVRNRAFESVDVEPFTMPRFSGLSGAPRCVLEEPIRLAMISTVFGERQVELSLIAAPDRLTVEASRKDYLELAATASGTGRTRLHRMVFDTIHSVCSTEIELTGAELTIVDEGIAKFALTFGDDARATYYAAPLIKPD